MKPPVSFAGERILLTRDESGRETLTYSDAGTGRVCGDCQLCCKLLPVAELELRKPAGKRCRHQRAGKGCMVYATRPMICRAFACRWLADRETADMPRPDRAHYVIDLTPDYVELVKDDGTRDRIGVIQVWVDPAFPQARRAPELRAYMLHVAMTRRMATIIRFNASDAITVFPPPLATDRQWHEEHVTRTVWRRPINVTVVTS